VNSVLEARSWLLSVEKTVIGDMAHQEPKETWSSRGETSGTTPAEEARSASFPIVEHIRDLPGEPYTLAAPIPVTVRRSSSIEFLARWDEANVAMTGDSPSDAMMLLVADILNTYEDYCDESGNLGPEPARQLDVMRRYIVRRLHA
jgi:hypothetical protein